MQPKKGRLNRIEEPKKPGAFSRRDLLKGAVGLGAVTALSGCANVEKDSGGVARKSVLGRSDLIRRENEKPGTRDWLLTNTRIDPATKYRCPWGGGYCWPTGLRAGDRLGFPVSTHAPSAFS